MSQRFESARRLSTEQAAPPYPVEKLHVERWPMHSYRKGEDKVARACSLELLERDNFCTEYEAVSSPTPDDIAQITLVPQDDRFGPSGIVTMPAFSAVSGLAGVSSGSSASCLSILVV